MAQVDSILQFPGCGYARFGVADMKEGVMAAGAILHYLALTQHTQIKHITTLGRIEADRYVRLDQFTVRNLELVAPMAQDGKSLLSVIDRTLSPMGARMLHRWTVFTAIFSDNWLREKDHTSSVSGLIIAGLCLLTFGADHFIIPSMTVMLVFLSVVRKRKKNAFLKRRTEEGVTQ